MYSQSGIRCNAIAPGAVETNIGQTIDFQKICKLANDTVMKGMVLSPRSGNPSEVAKVALFLASEDSSFVNGTVLTVDGGWTAY
jgi:NAD(P)-dependent dehydrogenase (short-subunit alcohol dehydrogenase family)